MENKQMRRRRRELLEVFKSGLCWVRFHSFDQVFKVSNLRFD